MAHYPLDIIHARTVGPYGSGRTFNGVTAGVGMGLLKFFQRMFFVEQGEAYTDNEWQQSRREALAAPGTKVYYDEELISRLTQEHRTLLTIYNQISQAYQAKKYKTVTKLLASFREEVYGHFLLENIKLYVYLRNVLRSDQQNTRIIQAFHKEINEIGKVVDQFLHRYIDIQWTESEVAQFGEELGTIGQALLTRIKREEKVLYPLYLPPDAYVG